MKHNKILTVMTAAGLMTMLAAGCQKDSVVLKASISPFGDNSKVTIGADVTPSFESDDAVMVNGVSYPVLGSGQSARLEVEHSSDGYTAIYPAEYVTSWNDGNAIIKLPRVQEYKTDANGNQQVKVPMGAVSDEHNHLAFTNLGSLLAVRVTNSFIGEDAGDLTIDSIQVIASGIALSGVAEVSNIGTTGRMFTVTSSNKTVSLVGEGGTSMGIKVLQEANSGYFYIAVPSVVSDDFDNRYTVRVICHNSNYKYFVAQTQANMYSGCIPLSYYAKVHFSTTSGNIQIKYPAAIDGLYSIAKKDGYRTYLDENNVVQPLYGLVKVDFAPKGNLQVYVDEHGEPQQWRFAEHQWDLIEGTGANTTIGTAAGWVDLFGSSRGSYTVNNLGEITSLTTTNNYGISMSTTESDYTSGQFVDWGSIPGVIDAVGDKWFTMSPYHYKFLLGYTWEDKDHMLPLGDPGTRDNAAKRYNANVTVDGHAGIVFLPDVWSWSYTLESFGSDRNGINSSFTAEEWAIMESAGAIFLPTGNQRISGALSAKDGGGLYATNIADCPAHPIHTHNHSGDGNEIGLSVRLAHNPIIIYYKDAAHTQPYGMESARVYDNVVYPQGDYKVFTDED